jgi:hypothetical protein
MAHCFVHFIAVDQSNLPGKWNAMGTIKACGAWLGISMVDLRNKVIYNVSVRKAQKLFIRWL